MYLYSNRKNLGAERGQLRAVRLVGDGHLDEVALEVGEAALARLQLGGLRGQLHLDRLGPVWDSTSINMYILQSGGLLANRIFCMISGNNIPNILTQLVLFKFVSFF